MELIGNLLNKAAQEKSLVTTQQSSPPQWGGLLLTLAQSRYKELTEAEIQLWKAKLSGYPNDLIEWALLDYNGEFFPNPSTICQAIERKREAMAEEKRQEYWPAWKAKQREAEQSGCMATERDLADVRETLAKIAMGPPLVTPVKRRDRQSANGKDSGSGTQPGIRPDVAKPGEHSSKA